MRIEQLPYYGYITFINRFRVLILAFFLLLVGFSAFFVKGGFVYNDKSLWLGGSQEYAKLLALKHPSLNIEKVVFDISGEGWNIETISKLKTLHVDLSTQENVVALNTLFEQSSLFENRLNEQQSMMEIVPFLQLDNQLIYDEIMALPERYRNFVDGEQVVFYIVSENDKILSNINSSYPYERSKEQGGSHMKDILLFSALFIILAASFTIAFRSILPTILGIVFITATTILTVALFQWLSATNVTHISIVILAVTVSVMDFIYIYYKWHVMHRRVPQKLVLYRVIVKTFVPIFWTTSISVVGIGSLILVDSHILYSMGMNVLLSATIGLILTFTVLPAMLSYFVQKKPDIVTKEGARYFANKEAHYKKKLLRLFLVFSALVFAYGIFMYFYKPMNVVTDTSGTQIKLALTEKGMSQETLLELQSIQSLIDGKYAGDVESYASAYTEIKNLFTQEYPEKPFNLLDVDVDAYVFMFDLYNVTKNLMLNDHLLLTIYLKNTDKKAEILDFIRHEKILLQDRSSLLQAAKMDSINTLFIVVFFILALIMCIIYYMTRTVQFVWIALLVNAIPLSWFFAVIMLLNIPLSTEILVAMIITVALSSDATMHFIFYYYNNRLKPRSSAKTLETSFLYIATPLGMGNIMLIFTFVSLIFVPDTTIANIGIYSALLVALSLVMELFVLPVLFLNLVKGNPDVQGFYHGN